MKRRRIAMMGVSTREKGGISTLANLLMDVSRSDSDTDISYIETTCNGGSWKKMVLFLHAAIKEKVLLRDGVQIVHIHMANNASFLRAYRFCSIAKSQGARIIVQIHCDLELFYESGSSRTRRFIDRVMEMADKLIVMGEYLCDFFARHGVDNDKFVVLRNSVIVPRENMYNPESNKVLFLGNVSVDKGIEDLLQAIRLIRSLLPPGIVFELCGRDLLGIDERVRTLGLEDLVKYRGIVTVSSEFFCDYRLNILPSHNEALPFSLLEASAAGVPSIVTNVGTISDLIKDGETGLVIPCGDVTALGRAIVELLNDKSLAISMSHSVYHRVARDYSFHGYYTHLLRIYDEVIS